MFMPYWFVRQQQKNTKSTNYFYDLKILDYARGYLTKNKITYNVYLVGSKSDEKSNFSDNIGLLIQNNSTGEVNKIALEVDEGYNGKIFLADFTGDGVDDIFISIDSGGSAGYGYFYIYSMQTGKPTMLFNFENFNANSNYLVLYKNYYKVDIVNQNGAKVYTLDIAYKQREYLSKIYGPNGKIKVNNRVEGQVLSVDELYPIYDYNNNVFNLLAYQRIIGIANADTLGYVVTLIVWDKDAKQFNIKYEYMATFGKKTTM